MNSFLAAQSHTSGFIFREIMLGASVFILGFWLQMSFYFKKHGHFKFLRPETQLAWWGIFVLMVGYAAINFEALYIAPKAVLLKGNFAYPIGIVIALIWLYRIYKEPTND